MGASTLPLILPHRGRSKLLIIPAMRLRLCDNVKMNLNARAKLEVKESELEAVRLRLTEAEKGLNESNAEADTLRAQSATGSANRDVDQITCRLLERVRAIEAEMVSKRLNEKSIEEMERRNEG